MKNKKYIVCLFLMFVAASGYAQKERTESLISQTLKGLEYRLKAGFNFGGTSPLPLPEEIRQLKGFNPNLNIAIEGDVVKKIGKSDFSVMIGICLENKGMETDALVKNYQMSIINGNAELAGRWTGGVKTKVRLACLTFPVLLQYKLSPRWELKIGPYFSWIAKGDFSGTVYDGYLRQGDPTGEKFSLNEASYDFSDNLRRFNWGAQIGAEWRAFKHLNVGLDLDWGLNSIFPSSFETVSFAMYPIYANLNFGYVF